MTPLSKPHTILLACAPGIAPFLQKEIETLGYAPLRTHETGVEIRGDFRDALRLNLRLRTANRVLIELAAFTARTANDLHAKLMNVAWEDFIPDDGFLTVTSFVKTDAVRDTRFATIKCKDAIVDRIRNRCGRRPDSGNERTGVVVFLYWNRQDVRVYLDTSGEALSRRGYRKNPMDAPMQETLAAAVIAATGWQGDRPFVNPMCGSGTLAIEAALLAGRRLPGSLRESFGFMHIKGYDPKLWQEVRAEGASAPAAAGPFPRIIASDIRPQAIRAARENARLAGVEDRIEFCICDFAATPIPAEPGLIILNPEYGTRLGEDHDLIPLYRWIGDFFKQKCKGHTGYVFTGNLDLAKQVGLRASRRILFFNSRIECRLLEFQLYEGTQRKKFQPPPP